MGNCISHLAVGLRPPTAMSWWRPGRSRFCCC